MPQIGIGGAEKQLLALIVNSDETLVKHKVLYYSDSNDTEGFKLYEKAGVQFERVPRNKKRPIKFLRDMASHIKSQNPDIVHCWLPSGNIWGRWAAILAGIKNIIVAYRNCYLPHARVTAFLEKLTSKKVHHFANGIACAKSVAQALKVPVSGFEVVHNGIDITRFNIPSQKEELKKSLGIPENNKVVTMVGRLTSQKNHPMLLKIAQKCKNMNLPVHFAIVGHGELFEKTTRLSRELNVSDVVHFMGLRKDIPQILKSSDIFCYTSLYEGFPNVILEAMTAALPIITTNFDGVEELIEDGVNGKIVPINDVDSAIKLIQLYINDVELATSCGTEAHKMVRINYSMKNMVDKTVSFYSKMLKEKKN